MSFYVHDEFPDHKKWERLWCTNPELWGRCMSLWTVAGCYCKRAKTDGHVSRERVLRLTPFGDSEALEAAEALVEHRWWEHEGDGYQFHDWADVQETAAEAQARRELDRQRKRDQRARNKRARTLRVRAESAKTPSGVRADSGGTPAGRRAESRQSLGVERRGEDRSTEAFSEREETEERPDPNDPGWRAMREFQGPLFNITQHDFVSFKVDWRWIGRQPAAERVAVIRTLVANPDWSAARWRRCTPTHIRKYWQTYAGGELPVASSYANANGRPTRGASEVGKPEEFANQEDEP